jgi:hypothetical protein
MRRTRTALRLGASLLVAAVLGGCADIYYDRRETVSSYVGDAVETNKVAHIIDPWPKAAANRSIEYDGERMQRASERYRTNRTTPLRSSSTSSVQYQPLAGGGNGSP